MTKFPLEGLGWVALSACLIACSGGAGDGRGGVGVDKRGVCTGTSDPCGGDLSGDWKVTTSCFTALPECTESYTTSMLPITTFSFQANGTVTLASSGAAAVETVENLACAGVTHCADLDDSKANRTCVANAAETCACSASGTVSNSATASYTVSDGTLTISVGTDSVSYGFCAKGNTLTLELKLLGIIYTLDRQ